MEDCAKLKKAKTNAHALSEENFRKRIKRLTGEVDMLEAYVESIGKLYMQVPRTRTSAKTELGKIMDSFRESV